MNEGALRDFARWMSDHGLINANDTAPEALVQEYLLDYAEDYGSDELGSTIEKEIRAVFTAQAEHLVKNAGCVGTTRLVVGRVSVQNAKQLDTFCSIFIDLLSPYPNHATLFGAEVDGRANLCCLVGSEANLSATDVIHEVAQHIQGRGGGHPSRAQAFGLPEGLPQALEAFGQVVRRLAFPGMAASSVVEPPTLAEDAKWRAERAPRTDPVHPDGPSVNQAPTEQAPRDAFVEGVQKIYDDIGIATALMRPGSDAFYSLQRIEERLRDLFIEMES